MTDEIERGVFYTLRNKVTGSFLSHDGEHTHDLNTMFMVGTRGRAISRFYQIDPSRRGVFEMCRVTMEILSTEVT